MSALEKFQSDSLSPQIRQIWGLEEGEEVYLEIVRASEVAQIKQKMREHEGLTHTEMETAADLGLIDRKQFWYWTPETQAQVRRAEEDLKAGRHEAFESVDDLFAAPTRL